MRDRHSNETYVGRCSFCPSAVREKKLSFVALKTSYKTTAYKTVFRQTPTVELDLFSEQANFAKKQTDKCELVTAIRDKTVFTDQCDIGIS